MEYQCEVGGMANLPVTVTLSGSTTRGLGGSRAGASAAFSVSLPLRCFPSGLVSFPFACFPCGLSSFLCDLGSVVDDEGALSAAFRFLSFLSFFVYLGGDGSSSASSSTALPLFRPLRNLETSRDRAG